MVEIKTFSKKEYPAARQTFGTADQRPASGYFSLHFTYPDTAYEDPTATQWTAGGNQLGMQFLIRTPLSDPTITTAGTTNSVSGEDARNGVNVVVIDLRRAAEAHAAQVALALAGGVTLAPKTYDLGTEEASRMIASVINSSRNRQAGAHSRTRYLRARYVKMSSPTSYTCDNLYALPYDTRNHGGGVFKAAATYLKGSTRVIDASVAISPYLKPNESVYTADTPNGTGSRFVGKVLDSFGQYITFHEPIAVDLATNQTLRGGWFTARLVGGSVMNRIPSDIPQRGTISGYSDYTLTYDKWEIRSEGMNTNVTDFIDFNITTVTKASGTIADIAALQSWVITNDTEEQHTVVVSWEMDTPTGGGYWGTANGGPIVQGLGTSLPVWYLTAKPMDGGNLGLPALNADSRGAVALSHTTNHGYSRFSIEALNSCAMPDTPPPDMPFDGPSIMGETEADPFQWTGQNNLLTAHQKDDLLIKKPEFGTKMDEMGPYESGCLVSTNATLVASATTIKALAPSTHFLDHFKEGDYLYKPDGTNLHFDHHFHYQRDA